jgi:hypothetical protein
MKAYEIAREIANSGDYCFLSDVLDELRINWESTYKDTLTELKENIEWYKEEN